MNHDFFQIWKDPPARYRSAPFWSWNGRLDPARLVRQIESMHKAGMGGFFMHSRSGLGTPYLSDEWFACVGACVEKARELGMKAYLYDEDRFPSGDAGGFVTREYPEFRAVTLRATPFGPAGDEGGLLASFSVETDACGQFLSYRRLVAGSSAANLHFVQQVNSPSGRHNDGTYIDVFNAGATTEFIRLTHEAYARRFQKDFGHVIPAIFFDEPQYQATVFYPDGSARLPWTPGFTSEFQKRYHYDLLDHLPELMYYSDRGDFSRVRYHYYRLCCELFVENFTRPLSRWCAEHHIALTGHLLGEADIFQTIVVGSCMAHYEHMQWPGLDVLTDQARELASAKQASSVADQLGKERVISEMYACTGWDWPLEGHKFVGDWHLAAGVNFRCQHLSCYTLAGSGKRDFPASIFHQSPWWSHYDVVEGYFTRMSAALMQGMPVRDVLVLHAIESAWGIFGPGGWNSRVISYLQDRWERVFQALTGWHCDWDFGDESLMERHATVEGHLLKVGRMTYRTVIVPPSFNMRRSTLELLRRFHSAGGQVLFVGRLADHVEALASDEPSVLASQCFTCGEQHADITNAILNLLPRRISITEDGREQTCIWSMLRDLEDAAGSQFLFVQSHDRNFSHDVHVRVRGRVPVVVWNAMDGRCHEMPCCRDGDDVAFDLHLPPSGSSLLSLGLTVPDASACVEVRAPESSVTLSGPFDVELGEFNTMPLDFCQFRIGDASFSPVLPSLSVHAQIRECLGVPPAGAQQPWYIHNVLDLKPRGRCTLRRCFHVTDLPAQCFLVLEQPGNYCITVNGRPCSSAPSGFWVDEDFVTLDITALLVAGENEMLFELDYRPDMDLEDMYLAGLFGVRKILAANERRYGNYTLSKPVTRLALGSWVGQGLDFYGGSVHYKIRLERPGGRVQIKLLQVACTMAVLHVNGRRFVLPWEPFEADITEALHPGGNEVSIEVVGGRKNILGPLHTPWTAGTGPGKFYPSDKDWTDCYLLNNHGLMAPVAVWTGH